MLKDMSRVLCGFLCASLVVLVSVLVPPTGGWTTAIAMAAEKTEPLDLNTATVEQLKTLPGIGNAYAKKILDNRPYKRKDELLQKKILPQATYEKIKDQIVAKQR
ncbi:ComEA family DNA-binding protein [Nitrospira sp. Kam-Ns4a]